MHVYIHTLVVKMTEKDYVYGAIRLMSMTTPTLRAIQTTNGSEIDKDEGTSELDRDIHISMNLDSLQRMEMFTANCKCLYTRIQFHLRDSKISYSI